MGAATMTNRGKFVEQIYKFDMTQRGRNVITYLINRANKEDLTCFPAVKTIARECSISPKTVRRALKDLLDLGLLKKEERWRDNGGQSSNLYTLVLDGKTPPRKTPKKSIKKRHTEVTGQIKMPVEQNKKESSSITSIGFEDLMNKSTKKENGKETENSENVVGQSPVDQLVPSEETIKDANASNSDNRKEKPIQLFKSAKKKSTKKAIKKNIGQVILDKAKKVLNNKKNDIKVEVIRVPGQHRIERANKKMEQNKVKNSGNGQKLENPDESNVCHGEGVKSSPP